MTRQEFNAAMKFEAEQLRIRRKPACKLYPVTYRRADGTARTIMVSVPR